MYVEGVKPWKRVKRFDPTGGIETNDKLRLKHYVDYLSIGKPTPFKSAPLRSLTWYDIVFVLLMVIHGSNTVWVFILERRKNCFNKRSQIQFARKVLVTFPRPHGHKVTDPKLFHVRMALSV